MPNPKNDEKQFHNDEKQFHKNRQWVESLKPNLVIWPIRFGWNLLKDRGYQTVLDYGCGYGLSIDALSKKTQRIVVGVDLSVARIKECRTKFPGPSHQFLVGDCESLCFKGGSFDCILGNAILHHITLVSAINEINRSLKSGGKAVFIEPLGHNPFITLVRKLTPRARTENEKPLSMNDIAEIEKGVSGKVIVHYFFLAILPLLPIYKLANENIRSCLISFANSIDRIIFTSFPYLRRFAWIAVIEIFKESL